MPAFVRRKVGSAFQIQAAQEQTERHTDARPERGTRGKRLKHHAGARLSAAGQVCVESHQTERQRAGNDDREQERGENAAARAAHHRLRDSGFVRSGKHERKRGAEHRDIDDEEHQNDRQSVEEVRADAGAEAGGNARPAFTLDFPAFLCVEGFHSFYILSVIRPCRRIRLRRAWCRWICSRALRWSCRFR